MSGGSHRGKKYLIHRSSCDGKLREIKIAGIYLPAGGNFPLVTSETY
jgi:hypothetical protein